jgi:short-subunit dehydrogenase
LGYEVREFGIHVALIEPGVIKSNFVNNMKIGKEVMAMQNRANLAINDNLPYAEITEKRISALMPRFEKGSSPRLVAEKVLEATVSDNPKTRYLVGEDALRMMERRKYAFDEEFGRMVMNSVLGRAT